MYGVRYVRYWYVAVTWRLIVDPIEVSRVGGYIYGNPRSFATMWIFGFRCVVSVMFNIGDMRATSSHVRFGLANDELLLPPFFL
jgi:hypothetical protein